MAIYKFEEPKQNKNNIDYQKVSGIVCVVTSIFALFCLITRFVPFMKSFLLGTAGLFCYPFFLTLLAIGFALIGHKKYVMPKKYGILISLSIIFVLCILQLIIVRNEGLLYFQYLARCYSQKTTAGGIIVGLIVSPVLYLLNRLGAYIIFITLAIIFIALSVDYIYYLGKNEELKKSIKLINKDNDVSSAPKITVKELENSLKNSSIVEEEKVANDDKVKLTLDAKQEQETTEEKAKRKLGLLASSMQDEESNSKYFRTEYNKDTDHVAQVDENNIAPTMPADNSLSKIQANLIDLKNRADKMSYPISNSASTHKNYQINTLNVNTLKQENQMPNKVVHDEISMPYFTENKQTGKSIIGESVMTTNVAENTNSNETIDDVNENNIIEVNNEIKIEANNDYKQNSIFDENDETNYEQTEPVFVEDEKDRKTLDVEDFTNNVLASLKKESNVSYSSPNTMFKEEPKPVEEPFVPKPKIDYVAPPIELLTTESMDLTLMNEDVVRKREELEMALDTFGIPAKCIGVVVGPAVTRYELEMPVGVSVKRLIALQEDIAYNLSSNGDIRIEAPIPGRRAVGIEVPNEKIAMVGLRDIILSREFMEAKNPLTLALGKDISGMVKTFSLVKVPHLLVAGTSGSGKSVCINSIILSLLYRYSPDELKLILVDPKHVEFSMYNNLPHLIMPNVISESEKALNALSWCVDEMERRFIVFSNAKVKNLEEYNESEEVLEGRADKMPYIVFIIDELADLLMTAKKEAEEYICRILQKARAAGIHMILATQRPSVDVVTGKIKANLNARICFALMTSADSKTVLDQGGAEKLLGKGDMLFISSDTSVPKRIQGCFVTTKEIDDIVTFVKENNGEFDFDIKTEQAIINPKKDDVVTQVDGDRASSDGYDPLMPQVLKSVIESGHASISMIQRKFLVGFPRAARIIDQMETAGYISPSDGSKSRSVYITMEEYENLYGEGWLNDNRWTKDKKSFSNKPWLW